MKTRLRELRARHWDSRTRYERRLVLAGAAVLGPVIFFLILWQPAHSALAHLHRTLPLMKAQANQLKEHAAEAEILRHRPPFATLNALALKTTLDESARRHHLRESITTLEAQEPASVHITCEQIAFAQWLDWLRELQQAQSVRADMVAVTALTQPGMVKISATFTGTH